MSASGSFVVSPALPNGDRDTSTEVSLDPKPTYPEYGDRLKSTEHLSEGRLIEQRSVRNPRKKKWVWADYGPDIIKYENQYWTLFNFQEHLRASSGASPYVYLKEDVTTNFGIYNSGTQRIEPEWIRCRILRVAREERREGGTVRYDETEMVFTIDDPNFIAV